MTKRSESKDTGGCPVSHNEYRVNRPAFETYRLLNEEREAHRFHWNDSTDHGFWMLTQYDDVVEALRMHEQLTNDQPTAFFDDLAVEFMPQGINPPRHTDVRRLLNPYFSPAAVQRLEGLARERARTMIAELKPQGGVDMGTGFAILYPTEIFLEVFGLPIEDGEKLLPWIEAIFGGFLAAGEASADDAEKANASLAEYLREAIADRRTNPGDPSLDLITRLLEGQVLGEPLPDKDILTICMSTLAAGLDTTRSSLGYIFYHLANHPEDRARVIADPSLWPVFIEECIRLYPLVIQVGRQAQQDMDHHGLKISKGDMVWLGLASANRDPRKFENPDTFDMDREGINHHLAFGAGPHRCLGMHLARRELVIALEEWHKQIPDYRMVPGSELVERGSQLRLESLPLAWE
jgi:cytochrome P450